MVSAISFSCQQIPCFRPSSASIADTSAVDDVIKKNEEKAKAAREKMGVYENQIRAAAAMNTRNMTNRSSVSISSDKEEQLKRAAELKTNVRPDSLAAKANMVREYNERNSRK